MYEVESFNHYYGHEMPQNIEKTAPPQMMEIKTSYEQQIVKKEVSSPPLGSPHLGLGEGSDPIAMASINPALAETDPVRHHNLIQLRHQQQIQQEILLQQYRRQQQELSEAHEKQLQQHIKHQQKQQYEQEQKQLAQEHEKQLQQHLKYLEQQTQKAEEERAERQRLEEEKIEAIKKKEKHEHSAVASNEVKQRLQDKILKKLRDNDQAIVGGPSSVRNWPAGHILPAPEDFPLRKTASEPNICLKVRLKQRMIDRRSSPIVRRKDKVAMPCSRRRPLTHADSASTPDSGQSSPPNGLPTSRSSSGSTPIHEEGGGSPYGATQGSCSDLSHPFSSLPNISLGRPPHSSQEGSKLAMVSETEMVTAARAGMPITGHVLPSTLPNYPTLPVIDSEVVHMGINALRHQRGLITAMDTGGGAIPLTGTIYHVAGPLNDAQQARLNRTIQRPLGRTQSAPLPLGHPMLQGAPPTFLPSGGSNPPPPQHQYEHKRELHPSSIVKQHIRQAVLKRTGSKNHVENVEEETEAAVAEAIANEKSPEEEGTAPSAEEQAEVIDLTERKMEALEGMRSYIYPPERLALQYSTRDHLALKPPNFYSMVLPFGPRSGSHIARPLSRALSSPLVTLSSTGPHQEPISISKQGATTGLAYDRLMQRHQCTCGINDAHPEHGGRIHAIWTRLQETGLAHRCYALSPRKATLEEIQSCHSEAHTIFFGTNPINRPFDFPKLTEMPIKNFVKMNCGGIGVDSDTIWNELHTWAAARMAVGCSMELAVKVAAGELRNGYAIVRPPGHHAEYQQAMGFCFFNTVAITARQLQQKLHLEKILIVDWDVHHGNGTQATFYDDPHILYISMHRYDDGSFFPGTGAPSEVGEGDGFGYNVNVAWSGGLNPPMGDAEYLAAFRSVVMPIAKDFDPDIVLVSAGFDAAEQHPPTLGGYKVSPACFAFMTRCLTSLARGKVVLVLEGGYEVESICDASDACVRALLGDELPPLSEIEATRRPCRNAVETLQNVIAYQVDHWPGIRRTSASICLSHLEAKGREEEQETVSAMASLRVDHHASHNASPEPLPSQAAPRNPNDEEEPMEQETAE